MSKRVEWERLGEVDTMYTPLTFQGIFAINFAMRSFLTLMGAWVPSPNFKLVSNDDRAGEQVDSNS